MLETKKKRKPRVPEDVNSERGILGCMLKNPSIATAVVSQLTQEHFSKKEHRAIFESAKKIVTTGRVLDIFVLNEQLATDRLDFLDSYDYLFSLVSEIVDTTNWEEYVNILKNLFGIKQVLLSGSALVKVAQESYDAEEAKRRAAEILLEVSGAAEESEGLVAVSQVMPKYLGKIEKLAKDPNLFKGLATGFDIFDLITHGLQKKAMYVLAARPGVGKTSYALNVAANVIKQDFNNPKGDQRVIAFFTLEMAAEEILHRLVCILSGISFNKIKRGQLNNQDFSRIFEVNTILSKTNLHIDATANTSPGEILAKCKKLAVEKGKVDLVIVDYLQLLSLSDKGGFSGNIVQDVTRISRSLKMLAMQLDVPLIAISQMSRKIDDKERVDKKPKLSDLRDSGAIEQDADVVFFLSREKENKEKGFQTIILGIEKNRHGDSQKQIRYDWHGDSIQFFESADQVIYDVQAQSLVGVRTQKGAKKKDAKKDGGNETDDGLDY